MLVPYMETIFNSIPSDPERIYAAAIINPFGDVKSVRVPQIMPERTVSITAFSDDSSVTFPALSGQTTGNGLMFANFSAWSLSPWVVFQQVPAQALTNTLSIKTNITAQSRPPGVLSSAAAATFTVAY